MSSKEYDRAYRQKNKERINLLERISYEKKKDNLKFKEKRKEKRNSKKYKKYRREYYEKNKERIRMQEKVAYENKKNNPDYKEKRNAHNRERNKTIDRILYVKKWNKENKERKDKMRAKKMGTEEGKRQYKKALEAQKERSDMYKNKVFDYYGRVCVCCKEDNIEFLSIDHIKNDGAQHRKIVPGGNIKRWLVKNNFPDGFQILCMNCNFAKGKSINKVCPHQNIL